MFSKTCEYAIRAMIFVAHKSKNGDKIGIKEIAKGINSPEHFIAKILQDLGKKGLIQSLKGPNGGFFFEDKSLNYSIADVVTAIDGDKLFNGCGLGLKECSASKPCPIHYEFKEIRDNIKNMLNAAKLNHFTDGLTNNLTFLSRK